MLMDRIMGALTFKREVYAEVEHDESFTGTAWVLVAVVAFLSQLGGSAIAEDISLGIVGTIVGTGFTLLGFALGAYVIAWAGKSLFQAEVTFDEVVRTLGLAYIWNIVGVLGLLSLAGEFFSFLLFPISCLAWIMGLVSWFIAAREALDLSDGQTIITVVIGWAVVFFVTFVGVFVVGLIGFGVAAAAGAL